jgi:hypothetical protein
MEQAFAHWAVKGTESKSNIDRLLRNKDFISPLKKLGWKANNYDSLVASVYDMDVFEMKWTRWELSYPDVVWNGIKSLTLDLYSLDIIDVVRFLIGQGTGKGAHVWQLDLPNLVSANSLQIWI